MMLNFDPAEQPTPNIGDSKRAMDIPEEGTFRAIISHVIEREERLSVVFAIYAPGEQYHLAGFWEDFSFSQRALPRLACLANILFGVDTSKSWSIDPPEMYGRGCRVTVQTKEYQGKVKRCATFDGFFPWEMKERDALQIAAACIAKRDRLAAEGGSEASNRNAANAAAKRSGASVQGNTEFSF